MYLRILKRDLKRKKSMNIILLAFIMLATMFISSSVNNIMAVAGGVDQFMDMAGVPDLVAVAIEQEDASDITEVVDSLNEIDRHEIQPILFLTSENLRVTGRETSTIGGSCIYQPYKDLQMQFFDRNDQPITAVAPGTVWLTTGVMEVMELSPGDRLEVCFGDIVRELTVAGSLKDASCLGGRFLVNSADYDCFAQIPEAIRGTIHHIYTTDPAMVTEVLNQSPSNIMFVGDRAKMATGFIMDMIVAGILMVVSICLILISFVVLRFTIAFTLTEEFKPIGVMKAIGISNFRIRWLYILKYFMLATVGAAAGFCLSIPFGNMMLQSVSETMVLGAAGGFGINTLCALAVVVIIMGFSWGCTRKVNTLTPIDAIRSGTTGERFRKKSFLRMGKTPGRPAFFMAANDVFSNPRRFISVILVFALCLLLVLILVNSVNTLKSENLITAFGMTRNHIYLSDSQTLTPILWENGREYAALALEKVEATLDEAGMPCSCTTEVQFSLILTHGDKTHKTTVYQGIGTSADQYDYYLGTAPQNSNEIAITQIVAQALGVNIGDTVTVRLMEGDRDFVVTALFQSMMNMGDSARIHQDAPVDFRQVSGVYQYQILFTDNPDRQEISDRKEQILALYEDGKAWTAEEYVEDQVGVADTINSVKLLVLAVALIIIVLVTVLMEHSFITRERSEIAVMKALGFRNGSIVFWHTLRFGIVAIIAAILALALQLPMTKLTVGPVFSLMGADFGIEYEIVPLQVFAIYPAVVLATTMVSAFLTAQYIRTIQTIECSNVD